jgi:hypothetical protein
MLAIPQIKGRAGRNIQKLDVFLAALDPGVGIGQRRFGVVRDMLVEFRVLLFGDLAFGPRPECRRLVDSLDFILGDVRLFLVVPLLLCHHDGQCNVVGILAQNGGQPPSGQQFILSLAQVQRDFSPTSGPGHVFDRVLALAGCHVAFPAHSVCGRQAGAARHQRHPVGDDERRIKADSELADQVGVLGLVAAQ